MIVEIGKPQPFPDEIDESYYCPFRILGLGDETCDYAGGLDGIQALINALETIGLRLLQTDAYKAKQLSWEGSEKGNLGLPKMDCTGILADLNL